jgi:hypothetical protein
MKKIILISIFIFIAINVYAINHLGIYGTLTRDVVAGLKLPTNAVVLMRSVHDRTGESDIDHTDVNGNFHLDCRLGKHTITISKGKIKLPPIIITIDHCPYELQITDYFER